MTFTASIAGRTSVRAWHPAWEETLWSRSSTFFHVNEIFCNAANGIDVYHGLPGVPQHAEARTLRSGPLYDTAAGSLTFFFSFDLLAHATNCSMQEYGKQTLSHSFPRHHVVLLCRP